MKDEELLRYSRHIFLPELDIEGQQALIDAHVMVIGAGGLGSPVIQYLAAAGIGHLSLVDDDAVELSNLQRQTIHRMASLGQAKVDSAAQQCQQLNPMISVSTYFTRCDYAWLNSSVDSRKHGLESTTEPNSDSGRAIDVIVDCTDNAAIRYDINRFCLEYQIPWVSAAAIAFSGQILVIDPGQPDSPCYRCLYPDLDSQQLNCADTGVLSPLVGLIGCTQAIETIRLIYPFGERQHGHLRTYDGFSGDWRRWQLSRRQDCSDCGAHPAG